MQCGVWGSFVEPVRPCAITKWKMWWHGSECVSILNPGERKEHENIRFKMVRRNTDSKKCLFSFIPMGTVKEEIG